MEEGNLLRCRWAVEWGGFFIVRVEWVEVWRVSETGRFWEGLVFVWLGEV